MAIIHDDLQIDNLLFNSDRNIMMTGGGVIGWSTGYQMSWTSPIYLTWFGDRGRGTADFNIIEVASSPITIPADHVAYVQVDNSTDGAALVPTVVLGSALPRGNDVFVVASHKDIGFGANNPLQLRNGQYVKIGSNWNAQFGFAVNAYAMDFASTTSLEVTHSLGSTDVFVMIQDNSSPKRIIYADEVEFLDANRVRLTFTDSAAGRVVIMKGNF